MTEQPADDPFHGCELGPDAVLGTHTFEDVLFIDDTEILVNVLTGETPAHSRATVEEDPRPFTGEGTCHCTADLTAPSVNHSNLVL